MSGSFESPIKVLLDLQTQGWLFTNHTLTLLTISLGELREFQKEDDSMIVTATISNEHSILEDTELYGPMLESYPLIEDYLNAKGTIFTTGQARFLFTNLKAKKLQMDFDVYACVDSFTCSKPPCILVPMRFLFDCVKVDKLNSNYVHDWNNMRQNFETFSLSECEDIAVNNSSGGGNVDMVIENVQDHSVYADNDNNDNTNVPYLTQCLEHSPCNLLQLHNIREGSFIGPYLADSAGFNHIFAPALLYALSFGHVPSFVHSPVAYLRKNMYSLSRLLHLVLTGSWINYPGNKLRKSVEQKVATFCGAPPAVLVYDEEDVVEYDTLKKNLRNALFQESVLKHQLVSVLIPRGPQFHYKNDSDREIHDSEFTLANEIVFVALRQLTSFLTMLRVNLVSLDDPNMPIRTLNVSIKKKTLMTQALSEIYYSGSMRSGVDCSSPLILPKFHQEHPPYWTVLIISPTNASDWIRFDMPFLIPSVSTFLFITYLQLLTPSATKIPTQIALHPCSCISASTNERIISKMDVLGEENYSNVRDEWNMDKNCQTRRDSKGQELESYVGKNRNSSVKEGQLGSDTNKRQVRTLFNS